MSLTRFRLRFAYLQNRGHSRDFNALPAVRHQAFTTASGPTRTGPRDVAARKPGSCRERAWTWVGLLLQAVVVLIALDALAFTVEPTVVDGEYNHLMSPRASQWTAARKAQVVTEHPVRRVIPAKPQSTG